MIICADCGAEFTTIEEYEKHREREIKIGSFGDEPA